VISGVRHTGIVVSDIEKAINFWVDLLGFEVQTDKLERGEFIDILLGLKNVSVRTVKLTAEDGTLIELLSFDSHKELELWKGSPFTNGITHIALNVKNIKILVSTLMKAGYYQVNSYQKSPDGKVLVCYLVGFENVLLELVQTI